MNTYINQYLEKAQASFEKKAVGVAENSATGISTVDVPADLYQGCAGVSFFFFFFFFFFFLNLKNPNFVSPRTAL